MYDRAGQPWSARFLFMRVAIILALWNCASQAGPDLLRDDLSRGINFLEKRFAADPDDFTAANQLAERLLRRSAWTGSLDDLRRANTVVTQSLRAIPAEQNAGGVTLAARVALAMHRFVEAKEFADKLTVLQPSKSQPHLLRGDASMELGDLDLAEWSFLDVVSKDGASVATEARLARLDLIRGRFEPAAEHFEGALNLARDLADSSPDTLVWCLLQRGEFAFGKGEWAEAERHYAKAQHLAPEHWSVLEHLAELRAAEGKEADAVELFTKAAKAADRPELWQALGDCHAFFKRTDQAKAAYERALAGYMASIERGEILYIHHLAGFFSDSQENAPEAVKWARKDLELRQSGAAHDALAWALYKNGDVPGALESIRRALQSGLSSAHVLYHASMIHISSGELAEGQRLLRKCAEVNPHYQSFHLHR